jgi:hypothetical protein
MTLKVLNKDSYQLPREFWKLRKQRPQTGLLKSEMNSFEVTAIKQ